MALTTTTNKAQYECNGVTADFDLAVRILDEDDVLVYLKDTTTGIETLLAKTTHYTIAAIGGDYDDGARITTVATYSSDYEITILREVDLDQDLDLEEGGDLSSSGLENALDKGVMQAQQISEHIGRTISAPASDSTDVSYDLGTVEERANKVLAFDADGNTTQVSLLETGSVGVDTDSGLSIEQNVIAAKVDGSTIDFDGNGKVYVPNDAIDSAQIADDAITADQIGADAVETAGVKDANITKAKIENLTDMTALGNVSGGAAAPAEVAIIDDDTMATASATNLSTAESIKAYVDEYAPQYSGTMIAENTGTSSAWVDLDVATLLSITPARYILNLRVFKSDAGVEDEIAVRTNGLGQEVGSSNEREGASGAQLSQNYQAFLTVVTDSSGVIEWNTEATLADVTVLTYQRVQ